jgi:predicted transcriptional regulator
MARRKSRTLTELELEIMQIVWRQAEVTVGELCAAFVEKGAPLALPSIRTMLGVLQDKGYVARKRKGRRYVYRPLVEEAEAHRSFLRDVLDRVFEGSPMSLVSSLLNIVMVSRSEIFSL